MPERNKHYQGFLEAAPDAVVIVDASGTIETVNAQTEVLFGYERNEIIGQPIEMLMPERFRVDHVDDLARYVRAPTARPMGTGLELRGLTKSGEEIRIEISLSPIETDHGERYAATVRVPRPATQSELLLVANAIDHVGAGIAELSDSLASALEGQERAAQDLRRTEQASKRRFAFQLLGVMSLFVIMFVVGVIVVIGDSRQNEILGRNAQLSRDRQQCAATLVANFDAKLGPIAAFVTNRGAPITPEVDEAAAELRAAADLMNEAPRLCYGATPNPDPIPR